MSLIHNYVPHLNTSEWVIKRELLPLRLLQSYVHSNLAQKPGNCTEDDLNANAQFQ